MPAVAVLRRCPTLPPIVEQAARRQHDLGGMRAELVRPLKLAHARTAEAAGTAAVRA